MFSRYFCRTPVTKIYPKGNYVVHPTLMNAVVIRKNVLVLHNILNEIEMKKLQFSIILVVLLQVN
jgi:hypothetical protein